MVNVSDIAWLAGLLEGEGSFGFRRPKHGRPDPMIQVRMCDQDIVHRVATMLGRTVRGPYSYQDKRGQVGVRKPTWQTSTCNRRAIEWMMTLYPFMGVRRREQIRKVIEFWKIPVPPPPSRIADCHPDRKHWGHGLCNRCYHRRYEAQRKAGLVTGPRWPGNVLAYLHAHGGTA